MVEPMRIDADAWLEIWERTRGPILAGEIRPLTFTAAAKLAKITGGFAYEHRIDGGTDILLPDERARLMSNRVAEERAGPSRAADR
jgi:hypothetical protein